MVDNNLKAKGDNKYHNITSGTVTASKALVVDANKDLNGLRNLTITGNLVTGSNTLSNAELAVLDGVTPGTVTASKALVVDASKNLSTVANLTATTYTVAAGGTFVSDKGTVSATGSGTSSSATLNTMAGVVTTPSMSSAAGATHVVTVSNSLVATTDIILASLTSASAGTPILQYITPGTGSFTITILNAHASVAFNNTAKAAYLVIK